MNIQHTTPRFAVEATFMGKTETVTGQAARTLVALVKAGRKGVTALEVSGWALRLAAYVHKLKKLGLDIEMIREPHTGKAGNGWHGRYVLKTPVTVEGM